MYNSDRSIRPLPLLDERRPRTRAADIQSRSVEEQPRQRVSKRTGDRHRFRTARSLKAAAPFVGVVG